MSASVSGFDKKKFAKASGWGNNCALNCFTHFFVEKVVTEDPLLITRFADPSNPFYDKYQGLLRTFEEYYGLEKSSVNTQSLLDLLGRYKNPLDHEAILAPVLRLHLSKTLKSAEECWTALGMEGAVKAYFKEGTISQVSKGFMNANEQIFKLRDQFRYGENWQEHKETAMLYELPTDSEVAYKHYKEEIFQKKLTVKKLQGLSKEAFNKVRADFGQSREAYMATAKKMWIDAGYELYKKHLSDILNAELITDSEVQMFAQHFGIGLQIYEQAAEEPFLVYDYHSEEVGQEIAEGFHFILANENNHWSYLTDSEVGANSHNRFYTEIDNSVFGIRVPHRTAYQIVQAIKEGVQGWLGSSQDIDKKVEAEKEKRPPAPVKKAPPAPAVKIPESQSMISIESELRQKLARAEAEIQKQRERAEKAEAELVALKQEMARSKSPQSSQSSGKKPPPPPSK